MLVIDEVQSGVGRTGSMWACSHDGVEPDIMCIGKGLASGLPLAGIVARREVMDWVPGGHGSTFGGNPVACAAANATLALVEDGLAANAAAVGAHLIEGVRSLQATQPLITQVRGRGLMIGIDLPDHDTADAARAGVLRARPARAHVRRTVRPHGPSPRRHDRPGRRRPRHPRRRPRLPRRCGMTLPTSDELAARAASILAACGAAGTRR